MLRSLDLGNEAFVVSCTQSNGQIECNLFNWTECWSEKLSLQQVHERAKHLNKRLQLNEEIISEILIQEEFDTATRKDEGTLLIKYTVEACPFYFEWNLHKNADVTFQKCLILPLMKIMDEMCKQISELTEVVRKKEVEIEQYKAEGAVLLRKTVATRKYNFEANTSNLKHVEKVFECLRKFTNLEPDVSTDVQKQKPEPIETNTKSPRKNKNMLQLLEKPTATLSYINTQSQSLSEEYSNNLFEETSSKSNTNDAVETNGTVSVSGNTNKNDCELVQSRNLEESYAKCTVNLPKNSMHPEPQNSQIDISITNNTHCDNSERKEKNQMKRNALIENDFEIEELFSWKKKTKVSAPESLSNLWTALRDLDNQRMGSQ